MRNFKPLTLALSRRERERGVALMTVMVVFVLASALVAAMLARAQLDGQRAANMFDQAQAVQYALGAEELARQVLAEDALSNPTADYPGQRWAQLSSGVPVARGSLAFALEDLQGRFNLNTLLSPDPTPAERFSRLLAAVGANAQILGAVQARLGSIENPHPIISVQTLRGMKEVSARDYAALEPYIAAFPEGEPLLNVNTASDTLLKIFLPDEPNYTQLVNRKTQKGYLTQDDVTSMGFNTKGMTVRSHYFRLRAKAQVNGRRVTLTSVIFRDIDGDGVVHAHIVSRDFSKVF